MFNEKREETMKKFYSFLFAAAALVGFAACSTDEGIENVAPEQEGVMEFVASFDETRTTLDGMDVKWCAGDQIDVNGEVFSIKNAAEYEAATTATFVGNKVERPYFAVYPASALSSRYTAGAGAINYVSLTLDANVGAGTFADGANIALAYNAENTTLAFENMLAVLKFQVTAACEEVTIRSNGFLAGTFNVAQDLTYAGFNTGNSEMTLTIDGGFQPGVDYYTTVIPYQAHTLTIEIDGVVVAEKESKTLVKNKIYNLGVLPEPLVETDYNVVGSFQGWNVDEGAAVKMYKSGDWAVAKGVELYKTDEFKIVKGNTWDVSYGFQSVTVLDVDTVVTLDGTQNIKAAKNGLFDIYFNGETLEAKYVCVEEYTTLTVDITIDNKANWSPLYITLKSGDNVIVSNATVTDNTYAVSGDYIGESLSYILSNGSKTLEGNVSITKNGATINLEETIIKLRVQLDTDNAKQWWGDTMKLYAWGTGTSMDASWPGVTMTSEGNYTWSINVPSELVGKTIDFLVHNGNGWQSSDAQVTISAEGNTLTGSSIGIN